MKTDPFTKIFSQFGIKIKAVWGEVERAIPAKSLFLRIVINFGGNDVSPCQYYGVKRIGDEKKWFKKYRCLFLALKFVE